MVLTSEKLAVIASSMLKHVQRCNQIHRDMLSSLNDF